jgi:hypothetical protein
MRLSRMTTRRWMVAVAVVALSIATERMRRESARYRELAERHAKIERACRKNANLLPLMKPSDWESLCGQMALGLSRSPERAVYHAGLRRKYERASRYPWLPVEPDPPEP